MSLPLKRNLPHTTDVVSRYLVITLNIGFALLGLVNGRTICLDIAMSTSSTCLDTVGFFDVRGYNCASKVDLN